MLKPPERAAFSNNSYVHAPTQTYDTYIIPLFLRPQIPLGMDTEIPRQSPWLRKGEERVAQNLRNNLQMETLGDYRAQYSRRPYSPLFARNPSRLRLVRYANIEGQIFRMDEEENQTHTWPLRTPITLGTWLLRLHRRHRRIHHPPLRQTPTSPQRS